MATKYGQAAFKKLAKLQAAFASRKRLLFGIAVVVVVYLMIQEYVL